jgi:S-DNA-T family DNA segregation ATPase FtsK/SpoIIIE
MAKKTKTSTKKKNTRFKAISAFFKSRQTQTIIGVFFILFAIFLSVAFISFFFSWQEDQSIINQFTDKNSISKNWLGKIGATLSHYAIYEGFGIGAFLVPYLLCISGLFWMFRTRLSKVIISWNWGLVSMVWIAITFGFLSEKYTTLSGVIGYELNDYLQRFLGSTGLAILLIFFFIAYLVIRFKVTPEVIINKFRSRKKHTDTIVEEEIATSTPEEPITIAFDKEQVKEEEETDIKPTDVEEKSEFELSLENLKPTIQKHSEVNETTTEEVAIEDEAEGENVEIAVEEVAEEKHVTENLSDKLVKDFGEFDPKLELGNYKFPTFNLLKQYNESISVDPEELELNKNKIVETLKNYKIGIAQIKATVGPTITLYEIVPDAGVRISKIKNLEDDIALSLSALGIRIIAPIPGKGTIGIEVPNKKSTIVSMHSVISSKKFQESTMELPIALGKTISNETFIVDLAKMPHLLMAGATGQGKSVGLNAVLTSLLYRKHPAEVKFVLVDPKKVELTLFNKIERHYLAKLPDTEEAIITDTTKVVNTLNSLCIEMDTRYDLLKTAMVRNIKEYNTKFKARKLNPENGHRFLPYIVLVIDEFADLIMTAGKEVETPIARLAQLARAIGIHLIVASSVSGNLAK